MRANGFRRGIIQAPTGAGKTVIICQMCSDGLGKGSWVYVLADRRRLTYQIRTTLFDGFGIRPGIVEAGHSEGTREPVQVISRDTLAAWERHGRNDLKPPDLVIVDECHKVMGATYQTIMSLWPRAAVMGFTATPARNDGRSLGDFFQFLECTVSSSQLIREGWLVKPTVYAPLELARRRKKGEGKGLAGDPVSHWKRHADGLPTIAFSRSVAESLALCDRFRALDIPAEHIDASADDAEREAKFKRLQQGETMILCSVKLLIEGVDIPEVSAAILWSKFGSPIEFFQATGRIMRPAPGKTKAVVLDHSGAAGVHGLPGEDVEWSLDLASTVGDRRQKAIEEGRKEVVVTCRGCGMAYSSAPACPGCGMSAPRVERRRTLAEQYEANRDSVLEVMASDEAKHLIHEQQQRVWVKAIKIAIAKKAKAGMAMGIFRSTCKVMPWQTDVTPQPEVRSDWQRPAEEVFSSYAR